MKKTSWPGNWKVVCDVCGFWFPSSDVKQRWDGLIVCHEDWETRHPQTLYGYKAHTSLPTFVRSEPEDDLLLVCDVVSSSGYTGLGSVGCIQVGNSSIPYNVLFDLFMNGHE